MSHREGVPDCECSEKCKSRWCALKEKLDNLWNRTHNSYHSLNGVLGDGTQNLQLEAGHNMDIQTVNGNHAIIACIPEVPEIPFDEVPTAGSRFAVRSGGVWSADEDIRRSVTQETAAREAADALFDGRINDLTLQLNNKVAKIGGEQTMGADMYRVTSSSRLRVEGQTDLVGTTRVPDTAVGSIGDEAVNSDRLMAEMQQHHLEIDTEMSDTSEDAVQNKVIKAYVDNAVDTAPYVKLDSSSTQMINSPIGIRGGYNGIMLNSYGGTIGRTAQIDMTPGVIELTAYGGNTDPDEIYGLRIDPNQAEFTNMDVLVPDTATGSSGNRAVNSDRLMAEISAQTGDYVKKTSPDLQTIDSLIAITKDTKQYLKTWGGSVPTIELGSSTIPVSVPDTTVGMRGTGAVNQTRLMDEIAAIPKDSVVTQGSTNAVESGAVWTMGNSAQQAITQLQNVVVALDSNKQDKMSANSPVRITADTVISLDMDAAPTADSGKPVTSKGLKTQFDNVASDLTTLGNAINTAAGRFGGLKIVGYWNGIIGSDSVGGVTKRSGTLTVQNYASPNIGLYLCSGFNAAYNNRIVMMQQFNSSPQVILSPADSTSATNFQFTCKTTETGSSTGALIPIHIIIFAIN